MFVIFKNKGVIDKRSITTFGISAKDNDQAIGYFGTGLKYAIAIAVREGLEIEVWGGTKKYKFGKRLDKVRDQEFSFITLNNTRMGFTTELGKTWKLWQAFRELYCNAKDENGEAYLSETLPEPEEGFTTVVVSGREFFDIWENRSSIVLETDPLETHASVEIHPGCSQYIFYRGIRVHDLKGKQTRYTYNILKDVDLTEDRTAKYEYDLKRAIVRGIVGITNRELIQELVRIPPEYYEHDLHFDGYNASPAEPFREVVEELVRTRDSFMNMSAATLFRTGNGGDLIDKLPRKELDELEQKRLNRAIDFCVKLGFAVSEYEIVVTEFLGQGVYGEAVNNKIYISHLAFLAGTKILAGTLLEEYLHLKHKLVDETRGMQNYLMDQIITLGEKVQQDIL